MCVCEDSSDGDVMGRRKIQWDGQESISYWRRVEGAGSLWEEFIATPAATRACTRFAV